MSVPAGLFVILVLFDESPSDHSFINTSIFVSIAFIFESFLIAKNCFKMSPAWVTLGLVPTIALIITNTMWLTPIKTVLASRKSRDLGPTNPIPYVITVLNCIGWMSYGLMKKDQFVFWSNVTGVVLGLFYSVNALTVLANKTGPNEELCDMYKTMEGLLLFAFAFWSLIFLIGVTAFNRFPDPKYQMEQLVGQLSMMFAIAYYFAPLSTLFEVVRMKDSSSLYGPVLVVNLVNSSLWFIYGLALLDFNLYFPNVFGVPLTIVQLILLVKYSKHRDIWSIFLAGGDESTYDRGNNNSGDALPRKASVLSSSEQSGSGSAAPPLEKQMVRSAMFDDYMDEEFDL